MLKGHAHLKGILLPPPTHTLLCQEFMKETPIGWILSSELSSISRPSCSALSWSGTTPSGKTTLFSMDRSIVLQLLVTIRHFQTAVGPNVGLGFESHLNLKLSCGIWSNFHQNKCLPTSWKHIHHVAMFGIA